jgi:hypothetical protein
MNRLWIHGWEATNSSPFEKGFTENALAGNPERRSGPRLTGNKLGAPTFLGELRYGPPHHWTVEIISAAAPNEARARITANIHALDPNAAAIRPSNAPAIHKIGHKTGAPAPTCNHASLRLSGVKRKRPAHNQNASEQATLRYPIPLAIVPRFICG